MIGKPSSGWSGSGPACDPSRSPAAAPGRVDGPIGDARGLGVDAPRPTYSWKSPPICQRSAWRAASSLGENRVRRHRSIVHRLAGNGRCGACARSAELLVAPAWQTRPVRPAEGFGHPLVAVQQSQRDPAGIGQVRGMAALELRDELVDRALSSAGGSCASRCGRQTILPVATSSMACSSSGSPSPERAAVGTTGTPKVARQLASSTCSPCRRASSIRFRQTTARSVISSTCKHQVQVALQPRGVGHDHRHVGLAEQDEIAGDLLVEAGRQQRIGAGQIDELVALAANTRTPPSARVTVLPGQLPVCCRSPVSALNTVLLPMLGLPARATT